MFTLLSTSHKFEKRSGKTRCAKATTARSVLRQVQHRCAGVRIEMLAVDFEMHVIAVVHVNTADAGLAGAARDSLICSGETTLLQSSCVNLDGFAIVRLRFGNDRKRQQNQLVALMRSAEKSATKQKRDLTENAKHCILSFLCC
jgi:hypothetical protein